MVSREHDVDSAMQERLGRQCCTQEWAVSADAAPAGYRGWLVLADDPEVASGGKKVAVLNSLGGASVKIGMVQRRLAWPQRKGDKQEENRLALAKRREWGQRCGNGELSKWESPDVSKEKTRNALTYNEFAEAESEDITASRSID